MPMPIQN